MSSAPVITIFVRHAKGCKWAGDEFAKRCRCRKAFSLDAKRHAVPTQGWDPLMGRGRAAKKFLEDQLAGRTPRVETTGKLLIEAMATALRNWILKH